MQRGDENDLLMSEELYGYIQTEINDLFGSSDESQTNYSQSVLQQTDLIEAVPSASSANTNPPQANDFPPSYPMDLSDVDYPGPWGFSVCLDCSVMRQPWEFSVDCNKVYVDMRQGVPLLFSLDNAQTTENLFIRMVPVYTEDKHFDEVVRRCVCHLQIGDITNQGVPEHIIQHIMRIQNDQARYFGNISENSRLNIVVPLRKPSVGADTVKETLEFVCKNSCVQGMDRRPIQIIFTLENLLGQVLGRRLLKVRVCSCPRRDKDKDERRRTLALAGPHQGKRRRLSPLPGGSQEDLQVYELNVNIVGRDNMRQALGFCRNIMADEVLRRGSQSDRSAPFRQCYDDIRALMGESSSSSSDDD